MELNPERILVTNRSPEKAQDVAKGCGGSAIAWEQLDDALALADIVLSTTGAPQPIVTHRRFDSILARRSRGTILSGSLGQGRSTQQRGQNCNQRSLHNPYHTALFHLARF